MSMTWNQYQQQALTTAIYPLKREVEYTVLGLCSEVGELAEALIQPWGDEWAKLVQGELGDNFWYVAAVADALKVPLQHVYDYVPDYEFPSHQEACEAMAVLTTEVGKIAGYVKKSIRDNDGFLASKARENILTSLCKIMAYLEWFATEELGVTVQGVLNDNLNKLADRKQRGVLQGSGDHR